jgi:hypothetical protein
MIAVRKLGARLALVAVVALLAAGCKTVAFSSVTQSASAGPCLPGTWKIDAQSLNESLPKTIPGVDLKATGDGVTLKLTDTTWTLRADQKLQGSVHTDYVDADGEVSVNAEAHGTYTGAAPKVEFTLAGLSGSAAAKVTVMGMDFDKKFDLPSVGLDKVYGLSGSASVTCSSGDLTLEIHGVKLHGHK